MTPGTAPGMPPAAPPGAAPGTPPAAPPGTPPATPPGTPPSLPPGAPPGLPPSQWESYTKWRDGVAGRVALIAAKQNQITTLYTSLISNINGQDLPAIYTTGTDVNAYVSHAIDFANEVQKDYANLTKYKKQIEDLELEIETINKLDDGLAKRYGVSLLDLREELSSGFMTEARQAIKQTQASQAQFLNANVLYLDAIDKKSKELLVGWDQVKDNAKQQLILGSVMAVLDILTATGISGSAAYKLFAGDGKVILNKSTRNINSLWEILGLRGGQVGDYVQNWVVTGRFLDGLNKYGIDTSQKGYDHIENKVNELTGPQSNFQILANRLNEHIEYVKKEEERRNNAPPNPFVPV